LADQGSARTSLVVGTGYPLGCRFDPPTPEGLFCCYQSTRTSSANSSFLSNVQGILESGQKLRAETDTLEFRSGN
jgi:hypothetical protein